MISDRHAIDTIFGALVLIVSCFACSGVVLLIDDGYRTDVSRSAQDVAEKFDFCLLSTIYVDRRIMNTSIWESVQLLDYIALKLRAIEIGASEGLEFDAEEQIAELLEFYFSWSESWRLDMMIDDSLAISLVEHGPSPVGSDVIVLERTIEMSGDSLCSISFSIKL